MVQIIQITAIPENKDVTKLQQGHVQIIQITAIPENSRISNGIRNSFK